MTYTHQVSILGTGAVGSSLASAFHEKGILIRGLFNRTLARAERLSQFTGANKTALFPGSTGCLGQICFICVPDDAITGVAQKLSELEGKFTNISFVHTSGSTPASALKPLQAKGAEVASFHPLQTFEGPAQSNVFRNSYISIQGDEWLANELQKLAELLEARPLVVNETQKASLHLAAVMASNYLVALMEASRKSLHLDMPDTDVIDIMQPLISKTWDNITRKGVDASLTGPIDRGDANTVVRHLAKLRNSPELSDVYTSLAGIALNISARKGLAEEKKQKIQAILDDAKR